MALQPVVPSESFSPHVSDFERLVSDFVAEWQVPGRITVGDLLCHHSGLPRHDWIWLPGDLSAQQMIAKLRYLQLSVDIRTTFQYSNLGYVVASVLAERVSGQSWPDFIRERLTDPLRMDVTFTTEDLATAADAAVPYVVDGDTRLRSDFWSVRAIAAGGMSTSIASFANRLRFHLGQGEFEGRRLLSPHLVRELQKPRVHVGGPEFPEYSDVHYGLGLRTHHYRGERIVWHGGGWTGTNALMMLSPDRAIGVAVLANLGMVPLSAPHVLANYVFDRMCGREPFPWLDRFRRQRRQIVAQIEADRRALEMTRRPSGQAIRNFMDYIGDYNHQGYGHITISHTEEGLRWAFRGMSELLTHLHYDTFELPDSPTSPGGLLPGRLPVSFSADRAGNMISLSVPFEPLVGDIVFNRVMPE
jgi:CubicO group peptidase (beta-lactamase class C family)